MGRTGNERGGGFQCIQTKAQLSRKLPGWEESEAGRVTFSVQHGSRVFVSCDRSELRLFPKADHQQASGGALCRLMTLSRATTLRTCWSFHTTHCSTTPAPSAPQCGPSGPCFTGTNVDVPQSIIGSRPVGIRAELSMWWCGHGQHWWVVMEKGLSTYWFC